MYAIWYDKLTILNSLHSEVEKKKYTHIQAVIYLVES